MPEPHPGLPAMEKAVFEPEKAVSDGWEEISTCPTAVTVTRAGMSEE